MALPEKFHVRARAMLGRSKTPGEVAKYFRGLHGLDVKAADIAALAPEGAPPPCRLWKEEIRALLDRRGELTLGDMEAMLKGDRKAISNACAKMVRAGEISKMTRNKIGVYASARVAGKAG